MKDDGRPFGRNFAKSGKLGERRVLEKISFGSGTRTRDYGIHMGWVQISESIVNQFPEGRLGVFLQITLI